jgi:hypothetical protein
MFTMVDALESRSLLSATFRDGTILVTGTDGADVIEFEAGRATIAVHVNGAVTRFDTPRVRAIEIGALGGDDRVILGGSLRVGARVFAGDGNDTIGGSRGADTIFGGGGNDFIAGRHGDDYLDGNAGDDTFEDWLGRDVVHGGGGHDRGLLGGAMLTSGVESRRVVYPRDDGTITKHDIYEVDELRGSGTRFVRDADGRLFLEYHGATGSGSNGVSFEKIRRRRDGTWEMTTIVTLAPFGTADMKYSTHRWEVTHAATDGLVLSTKTVRPASREYGFDEQVTVHSSVVLLPGRAMTPPRVG